MQRSSGTILATAFLLSVACTSLAQQAPLTFLFPLGGGQVTPPPLCQARGVGIARLNAAQTQLMLTIHHEVSNSTAAHAHRAPSGSAGPVLANLGAAASPITAVIDLSAPALADLLAGDLYVDVLSPQPTLIEVRGQIVNAFVPSVFVSEFCSDPLGPMGGLDTNMDGVPATPANDGDDEFVEIVNGTGTTVDLGGWTLADSVAVRHVFAPGTLVPPGGCIVVFGGGSVTTFNSRRLGGVTASTGSLDLDDGPDTIALADGMGVAIDTVAYAGLGDGESEVRDLPAAGAPFVLHTTLATGAAQSAGFFGDGVTRFPPARFRTQVAPMPLPPPGTFPAQTPPAVFCNIVPAAWQAASVDWVRDVNPKNKIDDTIDALPAGPFDVVVNFKVPVTQMKIDCLAALAPPATVRYVSRYISFVAMDAVSKSDVALIALDPDVAFIEQQFFFQPTLDFSVAAIKVRSSVDYPLDSVEFVLPSLDGTGVNIAVMDTGIANVDQGAIGPRHLGFDATPFIGGYDSFTETFVDPVDDHVGEDSFGNRAYLGHGTHVASIIMGQPTSPGGSSAGTKRGVAPAAGLIDVKIFNEDTFCCAPDNADWDKVAKTLEVVYDMRDIWSTDVINMSFCHCDGVNPIASDGLDAFSQLVDLTESFGITLVAAAGNQGPSNTTMATPAAATRAITVAASYCVGTVDRADDVLAGFSARGPRSGDSDADERDELKPDVTAPGQSIRAAWRALTNGAITYDPGGTSLAAAHVSGVAALIRQAFPSMPAASIKAVILDSAEPRGTPSNTSVDPVWNDGWGMGLLDAFAALDPLFGATDLTFPNYPPDPPWASPDITTNPFPPKAGDPATVTVMVQNVGTTMACARVELGVSVYSGGIPDFFDIGTKSVLVPGSTTVPVTFSWTPVAEEHQCLKAEIAYGFDTDYTNNSTSRNVTVAQSPVTFEVRNTLTTAPADIAFSVWFEGTVTPGWEVELLPSHVSLGGGDPPVKVRALAIPPAGAPLGEQITIHIGSFIGPNLLGGVSFIATKEIPVIKTFPYVEDFEAGDGGFTAGGTNGTWMLGTPSAAFISSAASGAGAWVTNLTGNHNDNENSFVESPVFDFSAVPCDPMLQFSHIFDTETGFDETHVELSVNGGPFVRLGNDAGDPGSVNWYGDGANMRWDGTSGPAGGWRTARHLLDGAAGNMVVIRWVFSSDGAVTNEGVGLDDVRILTGGNGGGQAPQAGLAVLDINEATEILGLPVASGCAGPYYANALPGGTVTVRFTGEPNQPIILFGGTLSPAAASFGPIGQLDIGAGIVIFADGTLPGLIDSLFVLSSNGVFDFSFGAPVSLSGMVLGTQSVIFVSGPNVVALSNAVQLTIG